MCMIRKNPKIELGSTFPNMKEFRLALRQFAIKGEFEIGKCKTDKKRYRGECKKEDYPWRITVHTGIDQSVTVLT